MKSFRLIAAAALMMSAVATPLPTAVAFAQDSPAQGVNGELIDYCYGLMASGDFDTLNLGECMSYNIVEGPGWAPKICDALLELGLLENFGFTSFSDCVRNVF